PDLLAELDGEAAHVGGAELVGAVGGQQPGLEHAHAEHGGEARRLGEPLVVVDGVEVARRALVAHEVGAGQRTEVPGVELISGRGHAGGFPVSMAVDRACATTFPCSSRKSVTLTTKVITPPRLPSFS